MPTREAVAGAAPLPEQRAERPSLLPGECRKLCYAVHGQPIIDGLGLFIPGQTITAIMGPNGAGKSILVRLLHGLLMPTSGQILWGGQGLSRATRQHQAMVFQRPVLLRRSVRANLLFVLRARGREAGQVADAWLQRIGLQDRAAQPARLLSGGEQQRLAMARALALTPQVLFLDEPTASLDPAATLAIEAMIRDAHTAGTTVVLVTHDIGQAHRVAHHVAFMNRGRILEQTPAQEFFDKPRTSAGADYLAGRIVL